YFVDLDPVLPEDVVIYVKFHAFNSEELSSDEFSHIRLFPQDCETYEFLSATDGLITDYSSVMFDYMLTGRKVILYTYDREEYQEVRGLKMDLAELPFPKVDTPEELKRELVLPKEYDEIGLLARVCPHDRKTDVTEVLCRRWIFGESSEKLPEEDIPYNGRKNVLIYMGGFDKNGLTTAGTNLLNNLDRDKNNYAVTYCVESLKNRQENITVLPDKVARMCFYHYRALTFTELFWYMIWRAWPEKMYAFVKKGLRKSFVRGAQRMFGGYRIDTMIQFTGYNEDMIGIVEQLPCNRIIYVHNDMEQEAKTRGNANKDILTHAYKAYDHVAAVTEDIMPAAKRIAEYKKEKGLPECNMSWCKNVIDHNRIRRMGEMELQFDDITVINQPEEKLLAAVDSDKKVFVTVGRYSPEKGHERLIKAFEIFHEKHPDTCLLIIGGHGVLWEQTVAWAEESPCAEDIFLVRFMSNPYPLIKKCDYFVLPSLYEGFGLVLVEADILGVPCYSTEIVGPSRFMKKYDGVLVEDSEQGVLDGMYLCMEGKVPEKLNIDYNQYNREAIAQIEAIL
ncbi:MAG: glycosyltransferase, partial [Lachnospiraceae bacterium]|nr:glycosyltransferase [Lachnospiraceae bacterium]